MTIVYNKKNSLCHIFYLPFYKELGFYICDSNLKSYEWFYLALNRLQYLIHTLWFLVSLLRLQKHFLSFSAIIFRYSKFIQITSASNIFIGCYLWLGHTHASPYIMAFFYFISVLSFVFFERNGKLPRTGWYLIYATTYFILQ